jgi:hypothetical protein
MLEKGGVLRTWALAEEPQPGKPISAELLPDHRLDYLDYEGPVSQDRGSVRRWDAGEYAALAESPARLEIEFRGERLRGTAVLETGPNGTEAPRWTFCVEAGDAGVEWGP